MSAHTPGPWRCEGPDPFGDYTIYKSPGSLAIAAVVSNLREPHEVAANAQLGTAAPKLLEAAKELVDACKDLDDFWNPEQGFDKPLARMEEAIDKAEGRD